MYGQASTGSKFNNNKFSQCSKAYMNDVVNVLINNQNNKKFCFKGNILFKIYCKLFYSFQNSTSLFVYNQIELLSF